MTTSERSSLIQVRTSHVSRPVARVIELSELEREFITLYVVDDSPKCDLVCVTWFINNHVTVYIYIYILCAFIFRTDQNIVPLPGKLVHRKPV